MDAKVPVHHLAHPEIYAHRQQRDRLVLAELLGRHQETARLAEGVAHGRIDRGLLVDLALRIRAEFLEIVRVAETHDDPFGLGFDQRVIDILELRSEEHTSELQSLMRISYAVFCLKKKKE